MEDIIEYDRPPLADYQLAAFFNDSRIAAIEANTKSGKTHTGMVWIHEQAISRPQKNYWWVAPVYPQAEIAYARLKEGIPRELRHPNDSDLTILLPNDHKIWFKSGEKPDNLYGSDVGAAVIDEASRLREEAWHAVRSTVTYTRGPIRIIGNVKGRKNWFYKLARRAEAGEQGYHHSKITANDAIKAGILDAEEVENAKRDLPERVFRELYMAEPSDDGGNPFGLGHIERCLAPLSTRPAIGHGIDLAKSVDWTVAIGLDHAMNVSVFDRFQSPWTETIARIHQVCGKRRALVDSTGVGDPVLESLQKGGRLAQFEGYKFTSESKQKLMEGLAVAIQGNKIHFPDGPIRMELENFEYEYTRTGVRYSAPEGMHDDCVVALALAWQLCHGQASLRPAPAQTKRPGQGPNIRGYYDRSNY